MTRSTPRTGLRLRLLAWLAALALLGAACGSGEPAGVSSEGNGSGSPSASASATAVAAPATTEPPAPTMTETAPATTAAPADSEPESESEIRFERIVSISPTGTEILFAIGAGDRVVAVDEFSYYPEGTPVTDLSGWNPNIEAIASYEPDLVVMSSDAEVSAALEALGIEVLVSDAPVSFDQVYEQIANFGQVLGLPEEADALVTEMTDSIAELVAVTPDTSGVTYFHELDNTLYSVTSATFIGQVYGLFGLENVADPADPDGSAYGYPQLSAEYLIDADPDLIFLADTLCCGQNAQTVAERPGWDQLSAVRNGNIVELNDDIVSRWGPRLVDFIAAISDALVSMGIQ